MSKISTLIGADMLLAIGTVQANAGLFSGPMKIMSPVYAEYRAYLREHGLSPIDDGGLMNCIADSYDGNGCWNEDRACSFKILHKCERKTPAPIH